MTISASDRTAGPFIGDGISKTYPFSFKVFARADLLVARTDASGIETVLVLDADYSVALNSNQSTTPGGTVTLSAALPSGYTLAMTSNISMTQGLDLTNNGGFYPAQITDALDRIVVQIQQVAAKVSGNLNIGSASAIQLLGKLATSVGAYFIGYGSSNVGGALDNLGRRNVIAQQYGLMALEDGGTSSASNAAALEALRVAAKAGKLSVFFPRGTYVLPAGVRLDADNTEWVFAPGAVLKLHDTQATGADFITFYAPINQRVIGLRVDANRAVQNAASFGSDRCAVLVQDAQGCVFYTPEIISSPGKGFGLVSSPGNTTRDVEIRGFKGGNCVTQALIIDGNNMTGFFDRVTVNGVRIGATSHAGVAINDGASNIALSDVIADVQNNTWDAVFIRDSFDIQLTNVRGKRGRNGVYVQRLNGYCGRIQMNNVVGEFSSQNGVFLVGAEDVTGGVVVGRNNAGAGINIAATSGAYRSKNISISAPAGYDDQGAPTQQYGLLVQGVDGCQLGKHTAYGNTTRNLSINRAATSKVDANTEQLASITTGSIAAGAQAVVTVAWPEAFEDASIDVRHAVEVGTSSLALSTTHIVAKTTAGAQVMVRNLGGAAFTGTLVVTARRMI